MVTWEPWFDGPRCRSCEKRAPKTAVKCPKCGGYLDVGSMGMDPARTSPVVAPAYDRGVGETPLVRSRWLERQSDAGAVFVKDEGRNPTGHVSDRGMTQAVAAASALGKETIGLASPGRSGVAVAAAAARGGRDAIVYVPSRAPFSTKAMTNVHGGELTVVDGRFADARAQYLDADVCADAWDVEPFTNPYARAAHAHVYHEIIAELDGRLPDVLVIPAGTGASVVGIGEAAIAHAETGRTDDVPRIVAAQPTGCAPIVDATADGGSDPSRVVAPDTICGELEIPDPTGGIAALGVLRNTNGTAIDISDPAALDAAVSLAKQSGVSASIAGGVAAAAATDPAVVEQGDSVVVINSGAGVQDADLLRSHLMARGI